MNEETESRNGVRNQISMTVHDQHVWQNSISFFLDGVSFIHKYNPLDQARAPKGRIWRKPREGLSYGCTAKGAHCGSGGRVAKFMVAVSYGKGVILCEQYETLNGRYFQSLVERERERECCYSVN